MTSTKTDFAPAQRSDATELASQSRTVAATAFFRELLNAVPEVLMVLNPNRQVVFANAAFCKMLGQDQLAKLIGQRPGELWGCMHANDNPGGCGTGPSCSKCGAVLAILSAQNGQDCVRECRIALDEGGGGLDLKVAATQVLVGELAYTVFSATDISGDKRRQVLEQLMFRNLSHGLEQVHDGLVDEGKEELSAVTSQLLGVITMHRLLAAAESGRLGRGRAR